MASKNKTSRKAVAAADTPRLASVPRWLPWAGYLLVLLFSVAWVVTHTVMVDRVTARLCAEMDEGIPQDQRLPFFLSEIAFDGYVWNRHAEKLGENGEWRVRYTDMDNAPKGREVHWSSGFAWFLRGLGEIYRASTGESLRNSIYRMSIWANPILLVIAIGILSPMSARRFGPLCGAVVAVGMVAVPTFYEGFLPAYPDHHGIINFALMGMLFGIAWAGAGWVQPPGGEDFVPPHSVRQARHGMIFSGVCSALGLWLSAFATVVVAVGIGLGAILSVAVATRKKVPATAAEYHAELWKTWAITTALVGFGLYLFEYFPHHLAMRLEVIHPLYLVAWLAGGWALAAITGWLAEPGRRIARFPWKTVLVCALICLSLPALILGGGERFYMLLDPFMQKMSENIAEGLPLMKRIEMGGLTWQMAFGWFPILLVAALGMQGSRAVGRGTKAALLLLCAPIVVVTILQFRQTRWGLLAGPLYIALAGITLPQLWRLVPRDTTSRVIASIMLAALAYLFVQPSLKNTFTIPYMQFTSKGKISLTPGQGLSLIHRRMAYAIREDAGGRDVVVLSSPNSSCLLAGFGGFRTVGTLYWENTEGLKEAAKALNAQSDDEALQRIQAHGVTHVALMSWENFIEPYFRILYPKPVAGKKLENSFGINALFKKTIPLWSRPLVFPPDGLTKGLKQDILLLSIHPEQSASEGAFHAARFVRRVEDNPVSAEVLLSSLVDRDPAFTPAKIELSDLYLTQNRTSAALSLLKESVRQMNGVEREDLVHKVSGALAEKNEWKARVDWLRDVVALPDSSPPALLNAALLLASSPEERDPESAERAIATIDPNGPFREARLLVEAAILAARGDFTAAREALKPLLTSSNTPIQTQALEMDHAYTNTQLFVPK